MSDPYETLAARLDERFGEQLTFIPSICGELTIEVDMENLIAVATALRNVAVFGCEVLRTVCGVDYLS